MLATLLEDLSSKGAVAVIGLILGSLIGIASARWKRYQERLNILRGDARDTVVIHQHLIERGLGPDGRPIAKSMRLRTLGQSQLDRVVPNGHLARELLDRAFKVTAHDTLISMEGAEGSYLLETLTNFVCDRAANAPFDHDLYVMAPCCEPAGLAEHQPITILIISVHDLALFENWTDCRNLDVEHGSDGARILTLMEVARRYRTEQAKIAQLRAAGQRTRYVETMYVLDLALDQKAAGAPLRNVNWGRFESVLQQLNLDAEGTTSTPANAAPRTTVTRAVLPGTTG